MPVVLPAACLRLLNIYIFRCYFFRGTVCSFLVFWGALQCNFQLPDAEFPQPHTSSCGQPSTKIPTTSVCAVRARMEMMSVRGFGNVKRSKLSSFR